MALWQTLRRWLEPTETHTEDMFSLGDRGEQPAAEQNAPTRLVSAQTLATGVMTHIDNMLEAAPKGKKALEKAGDLTDSLDENVKQIRALFRAPTNKDLVERDLLIATQPPTRAVMFFIEGLSDKQIQNEHILKPLMLLSHLDHHESEQGEHGATSFSIDTVLKRLLPGSQVTEQYDTATMGQSLLAGDSVLLFEGAKVGLAIETKSPPARSVSEPKNEQVVWGPHDAFNEAMRVNVALIRRRLKDPRLVTEIVQLGELSHTYTAIMYVDDLASPKLVAEVKRRVEGLKVDMVTAAGVLEQYIEDNPSSLLPGVLSTERPDRAAAYLAEGHVVIVVDTSPKAMICPVTFWGLMQTAEDYYLRYPFASLVRSLRIAALIVTLVVPAIYIAVVNYHQEMIPTELMLFIASSRETVPMPAVVELIAMDLSFELIREASVRIPSVIGQTMGLVASLVLGQAAVGAKIVSPLLIIIVAIAGLASFAIPNYLSGFGLRWMRFIVLAAATVLGFFGIGAVLFLMLIYLAGKRTFGVPYLSPVAPVRGPVTDVIMRPQLFEMEKRPQYMRPLNSRRQAEVVRRWDPLAKQMSEDSPETDGGESS